MAGIKSKGGKKNRKFGRNKTRGQCAAYERERRYDRNRKRRWMQILRREKFMNRAIAFCLHSEYAVKFSRGPHDHPNGPYLPDGMAVPMRIKKLCTQSSGLEE